MKLRGLFVALLPALGLAAASASAAPLPKMEGGAPASEIAQNVEKVHGWHRYCAWGPSRYHRHVPGYGNVRCGGPRVGYGFYGPRVHHWRWSGPRHHWHHRGHWGHHRR